MPVGCGPSGKTCPRWPPHLEQSTSVRTIPYAVSVSSSTTSLPAGAENAGQPQPESYFASDSKSSAPQPAQRYVPGSKTWSYSPLNGASVPFSRRTRYCSGASSTRHCSSVFSIFSTPYSLADRRFVTASPVSGRLVVAASDAFRRFDAGGCRLALCRRMVLEEVADDWLLRSLPLVEPAHRTRRRRGLHGFRFVFGLARNRQHGIN